VPCGHEHMGPEIAGLFHKTTGNARYVRTCHVADCKGMTVRLSLTKSCTNKIKKNSDTLYVNYTRQSVDLILDVSSFHSY
jgi:hypothetical protein